MDQSTALCRSSNQRATSKGHLGTDPIRTCRFAHRAVATPSHDPEVIHIPTSDAAIRNRAHLANGAARDGPPRGSVACRGPGAYSVCRFPGAGIPFLRPDGVSPGRGLSCRAGPAAAPPGLPAAGSAREAGVGPASVRGPRLVLPRADAARPAGLRGPDEGPVRPGAHRGFAMGPWPAGYTTRSTFSGRIAEGYGDLTGTHRWTPDFRSHHRNGPGWPRPAPCVVSARAGARIQRFPRVPVGHGVRSAAHRRWSASCGRVLCRCGPEPSLRGFVLSQRKGGTGVERPTHRVRINSHPGARSQLPFGGSDPPVPRRSRS